MRSVIFLSMKIKGKSVNKLIKNIGSNMIFLRIITLTHTFDFHLLALNCFALVHSTWSNFDWSSSVCLAFLSTSSIQSNNNKKKHLQTLAVMQIKKMKKKNSRELILVCNVWFSSAFAEASCWCAFSCPFPFVIWRWARSSSRIWAWISSILSCNARRNSNARSNVSVYITKATCTMGRNKYSVYIFNLFKSQNLNN